MGHDFLSEKGIAGLEKNGVPVEYVKEGYLYKVSCDEAGAVIKITL